MLVDGHVTLDRLHEIIQAAFGWWNYHLHEFEIGRTRYGTPQLDADWDPPKDCYQAGSLTFDRRDGDQVVQLSQDDRPTGQRAGLSVVDQPDVPLINLMPRYRRLQELSDSGRAEEIDQLRSEGLLPAARVFVGRSESGDALVVLHDGNGAPRLRLLVSEAGDTRIEGLDEREEVVWTFPPGPR